MSDIAAPSASPVEDARPILDTQEPSPPFDAARYLKTASERFAKPYQHMVLEMARLAGGPGKIEPEEYFSLRLFDDAGLAGTDKRAFAGVKGRHELVQKVNRLDTWRVVFNDKLAFNTLFAGYGFPTIATRGYVHERVTLPAIPVMRSADDLVAFLASATYPLFGKPWFSSLSLGTVGLESYEAASDTLALTSGRQVSGRAFAAEVMANYRDGYLFQERARPHVDVAALCGDRIATVRLYTMFGEKGPELFRACWKMPAGANTADNYWRKGNLLCALDRERGIITRATVGAGIDQAEVERHPETGAVLAGSPVPGWTELVALVLAGAQVLEQTPWLGWDVAMTDKGPVLVEVNDAPDVALPQMADRRGILDEQMQRFVTHWEARWQDYKRTSDDGARRLLAQKRSKIFGLFRKSA
jgi:hypothetical protein